MTPTGRKGWIRFRFRSRAEAEAAAETLRELEYDVRFDGRDDDGPTVAVDIAGCDLQSVLEIAQIHGGEFAGRDDGADDPAAENAASDDAATGEPVTAEVGDSADRSGDATPAGHGNDTGVASRDDPSGDDYDGFEAGVRA